MMKGHPPSPGLSSRSLVLAGLAVLVVATVSILGQLATAPNLDPWYRDLRKPAFNPPNWVFAPAWTALYALMACAVWRILRLPPATPRRMTALSLFFGQLVLNAAWAWMFFAAQSPLAGLINIVPQWLLILATIDRFRRLDALAAWYLCPLACWVGFAFVLNFEVWRLNA